MTVVFKASATPYGGASWSVYPGKIIVEAGAEVRNISGFAAFEFTGGPYSLRIDGSVYGQAPGYAEAPGTTGVLFGDSESRRPSVLVVGQSGVVSGNASVIAHQALDFTNKGQIEGSVQLSGFDDALQNDGHIFGAVYLGEGNDRLVSHGDIQSLIDAGDGSDTLRLYGDVSGDVLLGAGNNSLRNTANIGNVSAGDGKDSIVNDGHIQGNVNTDLGADTFANSGIVSGHVDLGAGANHFKNTGTISGYVASGSDADELQNSGVIAGTVALGDGNDRLVNSGTAQFVVMGTGNDTFINNGTVQQLIQMGSGDDKFTGGKNQDMVADEAGSDSYNLGGGDDIFDASAYSSLNQEKDIVAGGSNSKDSASLYLAGATHFGVFGDVYDASSETAGVIVNLGTGNFNQTFYWGSVSASAQTATGQFIGIDLISGFETVVTGTGSDILIGSKANDNLFGNSGDDKLFGGRGADLLFGGSDLDYFIYTSLNDSAVAASGRDTIGDFESQDVILLPGRINEVYLGTDMAFDGELGAITTATTENGWLVMVDIDGDKSADMAIAVLDGAHQLNWSQANFDFI